MEDVYSTEQLPAELGSGKWCGGPASDEPDVLTYRSLLCPGTLERLDWWASLTSDERDAELEETEKTGRWDLADGVDAILRHALAGRSAGEIAVRVQKTKPYVVGVLKKHGMLGNEAS